MYTFRFNPVFEEWVIIGEAIPKPTDLPDSALVNPGRKGDFLAANNPKTPFILDPELNHGFKGTPGQRQPEPKLDQLLHPEQPPVGEYEFLLYRGGKGLFEWGAKEWEEWMLLLIERIWQLHHNPHLHHFGFRFHTRGVMSLGGKYLRVGDLIASSHPLLGMNKLLDAKTAEKLKHKEQLLMAEFSGIGSLYATSAPSQKRELWFLPEKLTPSLDGIPDSPRRGLARLLAGLLPLLQSEFPKSAWILELHTSMSGMNPDSTWWLQIFEDPDGASSLAENLLPVKPLPEGFWQKLKYQLPKVRG